MGILNARKDNKLARNYTREGILRR